MVATRVFVDANVLWSKTLRDWLFLLRNTSGGEMFTVCSSEDVIAEVIYTLRREKPTAPGHLTRRVHDTIRDSLDYRVDNFPEGGASYPGADPHDMHVHAAAVADGCAVILTADKGFTTLLPEQVELLPYEIYRPDDFFVLIDNSAPLLVRDVCAQQLQYWCAKSGSVNLADRLESAGCPQFADRVRERLEEL